MAIRTQSEYPCWPAVGCCVELTSSSSSQCMPPLHARETLGTRSDWTADKQRCACRGNVVRLVNAGHERDPVRDISQDIAGFSDRHRDGKVLAHSIGAISQTSGLPYPPAWTPATSSTTLPYWTVPRKL
jgi:hypothetical protein